MFRLTGEVQQKFTSDSSAISDQFCSNLQHNFLYLKSLIFCWLACITGMAVLGQPADSSFIRAKDRTTLDSNRFQIMDSTVQNKDSSTVKSTVPILQSFDLISENNRWLQPGAPAFAMPNRTKRHPGDEMLFYVLLGLSGAVAFFRFFYNRYFDTLFRVFFNTTLRQSQLTDQLLQAKLASLLFNLVFILSGGLLAFFLVHRFARPPLMHGFSFFLICSISVAAIYAVKYLSLKFTGWLTGLKDILSDYAFVIFLINKMLGILLIPLLIVIAFADPILKEAALTASLILVALMFLMRFFRSYSLLQHRIKVSRFHFFLYISGVEILPILLLFKGLLIILYKNV